MRYSASDKTEIIRLVEQSPWPARRMLERRAGIPRSSFYRWYDRCISAADQEASRRFAPHGRIGSGTHPRGYPPPDCRPGAGSTGTEPAGTGGALYGQETIFCLGGVGLSAFESARSYRQPGLHRHQSGRGIQGQDHGTTSFGKPTSPISRLRAGAGAGAISPPCWTTSRASFSPGSSARR